MIYIKKIKKIKGDFQENYFIMWTIIKINVHIARPYQM